MNLYTAAMNPPWARFAERLFLVMTLALSDPYDANIVADHASLASGRWSGGGHVAGGRWRSLALAGGEPQVLPSLEEVEPTLTGVLPDGQK